MYKEHARVGIFCIMAVFKEWECFKVSARVALMLTRNLLE
jgi:hypothetical protein